MPVQSLELTEFRSYHALSLELDPAVNIFLGDNGQGKTNILEAVALMAYLKSFRTSSLTHVKNIKSPHYRITLQTGARDDSVKFEHYLERSKAGVKKQYWINGVETRPQDVFGRIRVVVFSPEQINLLLLGPDQRRRYLNFLMFQKSGRFFQDVLGYQEVLKQRNALVWRVSEGLSAREELVYWDEELVMRGSKIFAYRKNIIHELNETFEEHFQKIAGSDDKVVLEYRDGVGFWKSGDVNNEALNESEIQQRYQEAMLASLETDIQKKRTHVGVHRDNWDILLNRKRLMAYGSRGELRTALLALKFSERNILGEEKDVVVLLDDVFSELDPKRSEEVMNLLGKSQALITVCDEDTLPRAALDAAVFHVKDSEVVRGEKSTLGEDDTDGEKS